ncbi:MAG: SMC-Scp complex subunit ScpB [Planctomycetales bacterium]|nr:SMC-Scp complex subunit ScpB [Planctomycetales bacterium]
MSQPPPPHTPLPTQDSPSPESPAVQATAESAAKSGGFSLQRLSSAFARLMGATSVGSEADSDEIVTSEFGSTNSDPSSSAPHDDEYDPRGVTPAKVIEGLLFVGSRDGKPLTSRQLASALRDVDAEEVEQIIDALNASYAQDNVPYEVARVDGGFRLQLRPHYQRQRRQLQGRVRPAKLSAQAIEVLATVAYRQGVSGSQVDALRGGRSHAILAQLVRRRLLRIERGGPGSDATHYFTTDRFRQLVGIRSLDELPRPADLDDLEAAA